MVRYATWRRRPEDPQDARPCLIRPMPRVLPAQRLRNGLVVLGSVLLFAFSLTFGAPWPVVALVAGIVATVTVMRPGAHAHAALPTLGEDAAFPVTMELRTGWKRTGFENGWLGFADGWLVYEGLRTSFSLTKRHVGIRRDGTSYRLRLPEGRELRFTLLTDALQTTRPAGRSDAQGLREAFNAWTREPSPVGEPLWPPLGPSPHLLAGDLGILLVLMAMLATLAAVCLIAHLWAVAAFVGATAVLPCLAYRQLHEKLEEALRPAGASPSVGKEPPSVLP